MESFYGCPYDKQKGRLYFDTKAKHGRPADTIVIWFAYTPTGRVSKYWHTIRLNSDYFGELSDEKVETIISEKKIMFPKMPKGYSWSIPYRYS